jgi:sugar (pentulose or hexulose) kinase
MVIGVDIGTSSSKGVLVDLDGRVVASHVVEHAVQRPGPGRFEMDARVWWEEFVAIARQLGGAGVQAVGVSGMGPCVLLADEDDEPLRPAILYGIDTRAGRQIERLNERYGADEIVRRCGSALSSQAAGAKVAWVADEEPDLFARARRLYMPSSYLARRLTGEYVLDHHSASQCTPLYDWLEHDWWAHEIAGPIELPPLRWPGDAAGTVTAEAAAATGLPEGIPVITGTVDAWSDALSVGDLYRAALEATGFAVRHNVEAIEAAGGDIRRIVAVGGGTQGGLWTQIVSDITGRGQGIREQSIGASYGAAWLAAQLVEPVPIDAWNPVRETIEPRPGPYEELYALYRDLYPSTAETVHELARRQER